MVNVGRKNALGGKDKELWHGRIKVIRKRRDYDPSSCVRIHINFIGMWCHMGLALDQRKQIYKVVGPFFMVYFTNSYLSLNEKNINNISSIWELLWHLKKMIRHS